MSAEPEGVDYVMEVSTSVLDANSLFISSVSSPWQDESPETGTEAHWVALAKELNDADQKLAKNQDESINSLLLFVRHLTTTDEIYR
jgi:hypothetical protein